MVTKKTNLENEDTLQQEIAEKQDKLRQMKRAGSELELQSAVADMNTTEENPKRILKACYNYIAQHRALHKKNQSYGNHLE